METALPYTKGRADMTTTDKLPVVTPADWVPGPKQGWWTYNDYATLPNDGKRYEIVEGVLYMSPSPNIIHQRIAGRIFRYLATYIEDAGLGLVLDAPTDVELSPIDVFQPDVLVVLNAGLEKVQELKVVGAPDLVVEVASPSTSTQDRNKKYRVYAKAGVMEYWIVDPGTQTVELLVLEAGEYRSLGIFRGQAKLPSQVVPNLPVRVEQFFPKA
jgi:Uma2 family endonuclease